MAEGGVPEISTQKTEILNQLQSLLKKGDIWYIVDLKWFKQWKSYVGYESWDTYNVGDASANPGPIDNTPILQEGTSKLKEHLIDDLDYILLPEDGWKKLFAWYGMVEGQEPLPRKVIEEGVYSKSLKVEVYPWYLKICENSNIDEQINKEFSRCDTIEQLEKAMKKEFNISDEKEVRLWNRYMTNMYEPLNKKENTLQDAGLYQGQVIVIEQKNEDGTWPRQAPNKSTTVSTKESATGTSLSTRSGNTYGGSYGSSGYSYDPGRGSVTRGLCGLSNIGNTCFMNSAIQCMSNVPALTEYFLSEKWEQEVNEDNPLGMRGEIARAYAELIHIIWSGNYSYSVPRNFKYSVGRFAPQFSGYQQQDSQELMAFLLDGLHEDLNRIKKKPYVELNDGDNRPDKVVAAESWNNYKLRNDSIIVDIFHGLLKSTVKCPQCDKISVTFDPFCYLSLPLPVKKERQIDVFWVPLDPTKKLTQFKLTVPKTGGVIDLCESLSALVQVPKEYMVVTDVYNHRFHKVFTMNEALSQIMDRDDIFVYQIPITSHDDPDQLILPIYLREERGKNYSHQYSGTYQLFGQPLLLPVPRKNCSYDQLYNLILQRISRFVTIPADTEKWWVKEKTIDVENGSDETEENNSANDNATIQCNGVNDNEENHDSGMEISNGESSTSEITPDDENPPKYSDITNGRDNEKIDCDKTVRMFKFTVVNSYGTSEIDSKLVDDGNPLKLNNKMYVAVDWNPIAKEKFYNDSLAESIEAHDSTKNKSQKKQVIQLSDCLELFTTTEELGENDPWYCPECKKHQQATKKFDLWSLPDTLIIHLKRFSYNRYWRDKLDVLVEFPSKSFDLGPYVINPEKGQCSYELIGVANHFGGLGGGHYTAYCRHDETDSWYYFDDSSVSPSSADSTVTKAAYVLVYQRKGTLQPKQRNVTSTVTMNGDMNGQYKPEEMDTN